MPTACRQYLMDNDIVSNSIIASVVNKNPAIVREDNVSANTKPVNITSLHNFIICIPKFPPIGMAVPRWPYQINGWASEKTCGVLMLSGNNVNTRNHFQDQLRGVRSETLIMWQCFFFREKIYGTTRRAEYNLEQDY